MRIYRRLHANLSFLIGVLICGWVAALFCFLFPANQMKAGIPIAFLVIVLMVALRFGVAAGVLGSMLGAVIFAFFLYRPIGSLLIADKGARESIAWMLLGGLVLSYLLGPKAGGEHHSS